MTTLTVWKFNTTSGAEEFLAKLVPLQKEDIIEIQDAATVSWRNGKKKPQTKQALNLIGLGALDGAFWGLLFGVIFFCSHSWGSLGNGLGSDRGFFARLRD